MKYLGSLFLYLFSIIIPIGFLNLVFDGTTFYVVSATYMALWLMIYLNIHKIILLLLEAREIIDADELELFQSIKASSYKTYSTAPKVYLYSGGYKNCFVLDSEKEWVIVLDKTLLKSLSHEEQQELVDYLYNARRSSKTYFATKALGLCVLFYASFFWFLQNILFLKANYRIFRVLAFFYVFITKPLMIPVEKLIARTDKIQASVGLRPIYHQVRPKNPYAVFTRSLLDADLKIKNMLIDYMEAHPILKQCEFIDEY